MSCGLKQIGIGYIQRLAADGGDIGGKPACVPHLQRRIAGIGFTVPENQHINGTLPLGQKAVGHDIIHARIVIVVFRTKDNREQG